MMNSSNKGICKVDTKMKGDENLSRLVCLNVQVMNFVSIDLARAYLSGNTMQNKKKITIFLEWDLLALISCFFTCEAMYHSS